MDAVHNPRLAARGEHASRTELDLLGVVIDPTPPSIQPAPLPSELVAGMIGAATVTSGLTRANRPQRAVLMTTAAAGVGAVLGVALVILIVAGALVVAGGILASVLDAR